MASPRPGPPLPPAAGAAGESELVARTLAGEEGAFEQLVRRAAPGAIAAARRVTGDPALAEDAAQEAFVRAFRRLSAYRDQGSFAAWVRKIAVHAAVDLTRRRRPSRAIEEDDGEVDGRRRIEDADLLRRVLDALSPVDREILLARELDGEEDREIAARLGLTVTTLRVRVHRARRRLRRRFREARP